MKHNLNFIKNKHICCDIFDDLDNLIIGNYMIPVSTIPDDIDLFFVEKIYPSIEKMLTPKESETIQIEASPILQAMEETKESIKFDLIAYIKANATVTLPDFIAYCDQTFGWQEAGFVMKMMYEYIKQAEKKGMVSLVGTSKEYYFNALKQIILGSTYEELNKRLK